MQKCHDQLIAYRFLQVESHAMELVDWSVIQTVSPQKKCDEIYRFHFTRTEHWCSRNKHAAETRQRMPAKPVAHEQQVTRGTASFCTLKCYKSENVF
jgi:hypothetical protein